MMEIADYTLQTPRLRLELLKEADADAIWPYVSNPEISRLMAWEAHQDINTTIEFLQNVEKAFREQRAISWAIYRDDKIVGVFSIISIVRAHRSLTFNKAELAYWLGPEHQGQGIMVEAGQSVLEFAFEKLGLHKIYVGHHDGNEGSKKLIERLKFRYSHLEREAFRKNNEWIDVHYYDMLEKEYTLLYKNK